MKYFLTVDWCNLGRRGIFCAQDGSAYYKEMEHTQEEIWDILDAFSMVLSPKSLPLSEEEIKTYRYWYPLGEFSNQYGVVLKADAPHQP